MRFSCENLDVLVLTYNRAKTLRVMLDSLCTQTAVGFRIRILNNASTDNTLEVVEEIKRLYPDRNIEVLTSPVNLGNVGNFKHSQEVAENEYTAVFHDDDAVHPEYIETAMRIFKNNPDLAMVAGYLDARFNVTNYDWCVLCKNYMVYPKIKGVYLGLLAERPMCCATIYNTKIYKRLVYHPEKYGKLHDICFIFDVSMEGDTAFVLGPCIRYGQSPMQDSNNLKTGPFPNEVANVCGHYEELAGNCLTSKFLIWRFGIFLFEWSRIKNMSIDEFKRDYLLKSLKWKHYKIFDIIPVREIMRIVSKLKRKYYKRKLRRNFGS